MTHDPETKAEHDFRNVFLKTRSILSELIGRPLTSVDLLVLGCGYDYPEVILFSNVCRRVVGLDVIGAFYRDGISSTFRDRAKARNIIGKALSAILTLSDRHTLWRYYTHLRKISNLVIDHEKYELLSYNGHRMPFGESTFDVVVSSSVLEHVQDLETVVQEVYRITRSEGISLHLWHNYYSLSGGHRPERLALKFPWGHIRGKYRPRADLNKLYPGQMQNLFSEYFNIIGFYGVDKHHRRKGVNANYISEGHDFYSESIRDELRAFSRELLLTRGYLIIGRRKDR